jgi:alkylated DNA repair dioxygenase AlkB
LSACSFPFSIANLPIFFPITARLSFSPSFSPKSSRIGFFQQLQENLEWRQEPILLFGKQVMQPRLTALYGDSSRPYGYSGILMTPLALTPALKEIKSRVEKFSGNSYTHVLCNYYRDGQDSMGWHRDNEAVLGKNPSIASVTFGATRNFQMRFHETKSDKITLPLSHGSLLLMQGESQHYWEHQLPKTKTCQQGRINLTFRRIL